MSLTSLKERAFENKSVKDSYDELYEEFELISYLITMREQSGLTQSQIAEKMGTKSPNISRLESGRSNPSLKTLSNYAFACGFKLNLGFTAVN